MGICTQHTGGLSRNRIPHFERKTMTSPRTTNKRPMKERTGYEDANKVYRFKMLLPNGTSVGLVVRDTEPIMEFGDFIKLIKDEYDASLRQHQSMKKKRPINWNSEKLHLEDANDNKTRTRINFENFKPFKCHILRLHDGSGETMDTFENMWDLTPDTDLLMELPEAYTFETALADLIDNSLQAVWSNDENCRRLIRVYVSEGRISIFDTGSGMDGSDENSIAKWGKMGASLHRSSKAQGIGGKPPYLMPCFGMFGYGGPIASMHLGRHALVSSKTKSSKKVYTLHLEREALLSPSGSGVTWRTDGGLRDPSEDEVGLSPQGSFTKVEIVEPKMKSLDLYKLQCKLKDIYFPYIQCDEVSKTGKTETPIEFQVNGVDLTEIEGGEVAVTNLHSCNGDEFTFQLHFSLRKDHHSTKSPGSKASQEANARLRCVYLPIVEGKENIERILESLEAQGCGIPENYESFSRVSVRRLGRLLPDARWALLPFMDFKLKKGDKSLLLKRCCMRVKCFIETDAGFNPTPSKTDLAHHNLFTIALKTFGSKSFEKEKNSGSKSVEKEKDITIKVHRSGRQINPSQLEREYENWILQMHDGHDEEISSGEDEPVLVICPLNKKELGISSDVVRVHRIFKRKGMSWKCGQNIKILKGACAGCWKNNVYATLEYFLIEGFQGDAGGEARIICRPLGVPDDSGCILEVNDGNARLDIRNSLSFPISIIDCGKCYAIEKNEWEDRLEKQKQKAPSMIELLNEKHSQELEFDGALPLDVTVLAGQVPPSKIVAVVRPGNFDSSGASKNLDQKFIIKSNFEMLLEVKFRNEAKSQDDQHVYSGRAAPSSLKGFHGLYIFSLGCRFPKLFENAGVYTFSFSIPEPRCKTCVKHVLVKGSSQVGEWKIISHEKNTPYCIRVGSSFPPCSIACYDIYGNQIHFTSIPSVMAKLITKKGLCIEIDKVKAELSHDKLILKIENILIQCSELDKIRPSYDATLVIYEEDDFVSVSIPCEITPGSLRHVIAQSPTLGNHLLPGCVVKHLMLEMFDEYDNHIREGSEVELNVDGFHIQDQIGSKRKVNDLGYVDLSGVLKVNVGYGKSASLVVLSDSKEIFKQEFQTETRKLKVASQVPQSCIAGSHLENVVFEIVDSNNEVDGTIHFDEECNGAHTLTIKSESFNKNQLIQYAFRHGRCTIPVVPLPKNKGTFCFEASHSRYAELHLTIKIRLETPKNAEAEPATDLERHELQLSCSESLLLEDPSNCHAANVVSLVNNEKVLADEIEKYGLLIGRLENQLELLNGFKAKIEHEKGDLQDNLDCLCTQEEIIRRIENKGDSAAAIYCCLSRRYIFEEPQSRLMKNFVGLVALLGTVQSRELSRILAEYLGEDQLLAVVCRSFEAACELESYNQDGKVNYNLGLHAEAAALGKSINDRFLVICLEDIRAYTGEFIKDDPQEKLALPDPTLPTGEILPGFIGYAVNMVNIDAHHLKNTKTAANHGLRETLFYRLFGEVQVYKTRKHMDTARAYINHGAISLDGGILRPSGFVSLGIRNPEIYFPVQIQKSPESIKISRQIEENKVSLEKINLKIQEVTDYHKKAIKKFGKKKAKYLKLLDDIKPVLEDYHQEFKPATVTSEYES